MLKALLKTRMLALINSFTARMTAKTKKTKGVLILFLVLIVYCVGCFAMLFGMFFDQICEPFHALKIDWLYFSMTAMTAFALMFLGSIFTTQAQLYDAKDNELLLSMPIPPKYILFTRIILIIVLNLIFELLVIVPAAVIYCLKIGATVGGVIAFIIISIVLPLFSTAFSSIIGFFVAKISSKMRNKSAGTAVFSLVFLGAYFFLFSKANEYISLLIAKGDIFAKNIKGAILPVYWIGNSIASFNFIQLILSIIVMVVPFIIVYYILSKTFISIATSKKGFKKIVYKETSMAVSSAKAALFNKEWKHFLSSPMYMLNASLGCLICVILGVVLIFKQDLISTLTVQIPEISSYIAPIIIFALCIMSSTNNISAPSISLEGKNLWIAKSIPVSYTDIIFSKIYLHSAVCMPCILFVSIVFSAIIKTSVLMKFFFVVIPLIFTFLIALAGVCINLKYPKFDWTSEIQPIKQGFSTVITMLVGFVLVLIPGMLYLLVAQLPNIANETFFLLLTILYTLLCFLLVKWLTIKGEKIFEEF